MEKHAVKVGDSVKPDKWMHGNPLTRDDGFSDSEFPGCQFRLRTPNTIIGTNLAVNITVTGKPRLCNYGGWKSRVKIEFVGDGEPSTFSGGFVYHDTI